MPDLATLFALLFPRPLIHHPILVEPFDGFQGHTGVQHWGA